MSHKVLSNMKKWTAFFSQTGSEIGSISQAIGRWPDTICTNKSVESMSSINLKLLENCFNKIIFLPKNPSVIEYITALKQSANDVITLNGYLRIIPDIICNSYEIYNGHPGDIETYPELKGKDPQQKACDLGLHSSGSVIHQVIAEVDSGSIECIKRCKIYPTSVCKTYEVLHKNSINLWVEFLAKKLNIKL